MHHYHSCLWLTFRLLATHLYDPIIANYPNNNNNGPNCSLLQSPIWLPNLLSTSNLTQPGLCFPALLHAVLVTIALLVVNWQRGRRTFVVLVWKFVLSCLGCFFRFQVRITMDKAIHYTKSLRLHPENTVPQNFFHHSWYDPRCQINRPNRFLQYSKFPHKLIISLAMWSRGRVAPWVNWRS